MIRRIMIVIFALIASMLLFFLGDNSTELLLIVITLNVIMGIIAFTLNTKLSHKLSIKKQLDVEDNIPKEIVESQRIVEETMARVDLSVTGAKYRHQEYKKFEKKIDLILDNTLKIIRAHIATHTVAIFFPTDDNGYYLRKYISNNENINKNAVIYPGVGVIGSFIKDGFKQLKLTDIVTDSKTLYYYSSDAGIRSLMASPIDVEGVERGVIIIDSTEKAYFSDENHAFLSTMADQCGTAVFYAYMYNQHKLDHARLVAMSNTEKYFFEKYSVNAVLEKLLEIIPFAFSCDRLTISLLAESSEENNTAIIKQAWGTDIKDLLGYEFSINERSLANVVYTKNFPIYRNFSIDHYEIRYFSNESQTKLFRSFLAYPIGVDKCKGMILLESYNSETYNEGSRELLSKLVSSAGLAIEKIQLLKRTENLAIRDGLTGLYNHRQFQIMLKESITRTTRYEKPLTLVLCDIDHFKNLNDTYGHRFGDQVLKVVSAKLENSVREGIDSTFRYGGEEFTLVLAETDANTAMETVNRICQTIANITYQTPKGNEINVTMSFGISVYGVHAKKQELLIQTADKALYKAKDNGRNRVELYYTENV